VLVKEDRMAHDVFAASRWAAVQFGGVQLGDARRTARAVRLATQMALAPSMSLPRQTGRWKDTKASYRFLDTEAVTFEALQAAHWRATLDSARGYPTVLMIEDTSELDFTGKDVGEKLGPIGDHRGRGLLLHSTLAVVPTEHGRVLGLGHQQLFARRPTPDDETRTQRRKRARESEKWIKGMESIGGPPEGTRYVHLADREADDFRVYQGARRHGWDFLVRAAQDRRGAFDHGASKPSGRLLDLVRGLPASGSRMLSVRERPGRSARKTELSVSFGAVTLFAPDLAVQSGEEREPVRCWVVRVWEPSPPVGEEAIEWVLLTSLAVADLAGALQIAEWYAMRWLVEEYHKCLKTGCSVEKRQLEEQHRLKACIAMLAVVATRLLQLKHTAREAPQTPALEVGPVDHVRVLAAYRQHRAEEWTIREFWREVAKLGGFLGRKGDGEPGWQSLWHGWQKLDAMTLGATLLRAEPRGCG
jgi:hypothetical protein